MSDSPGPSRGAPSSGSGEALQGLIWKIDRSATHDGPGIRTVLYFKGCPLRCRWCSNPESQDTKPALVFSESKCDGCSLCVEACPSRGLTIEKTPEGIFKANIDRQTCDSCGMCAERCPAAALEIWGKRYSITELLRILERDRAIHRRTGGGVTCSGGEPVLQSRFLLEFLAACRSHGVHTAVETSACVPEDRFAPILEVVDWLFIDLKHLGYSQHKLLAGAGNRAILNNARLASSILKARNKSLVIRMVVVPGLNDGDNIRALADFMETLPFVSHVELLPYHRLGTYKYELVGLEYPLPHVESPGSEEIRKITGYLQDRGIAVSNA